MRGEYNKWEGTRNKSTNIKSSQGKPFCSAAVGPLAVVRFSPQTLSGGPARGGGLGIYSTPAVEHSFWKSWNAWGAYRDHCLSGTQDVSVRLCYKTHNSIWPKTVRTGISLS